MPARASPIASDMPAIPPPTIRTRLTMASRGDAAVPAETSIAPALLPQPLADGAGDARLGGGHRHHLRHAAGDFQYELGLDRFLELLALADRDHERARTADHAVLEVDVELIDIHRARVRPLEHDRQAVDGDAF